jgi:methionyl-tRNA formyltransferase
MSLKIIFCGTPEFAVPALQALLDSQHKVVAVYTQPDRPAGRGRQLTASPVKMLALKHHLLVYQPESLRDLNEQNILQNISADLMVVVAYGLLLPKAVLAMPRYGAINVHPSLLPRWRGSTPIQSAILAGDKITGVSIIQLTPRMDAGPVLLQTSHDLSGEENSGQLHDLLATQGAQVLLQTLEMLMAENLRPVPQEEILATYTRKIAKNDGKLDWLLTAEQLARQVRAYNPWPVAFTAVDGKVLRVWKAQPLPEHTQAAPGTLVNLNNYGIDIATGAGTLRLLQVQWPGGKPISVAECIHGQRQPWTVNFTYFE